MKKYALVNKRRVNHPVRDIEVTVWDVKALVDIPAHNVRAGDIGGTIDRKSNLSQEGDAWIGENAYVLDKSTVKDAALVTDKAVISGVVVKDHAKVFGHAVVLEGNSPHPATYFHISNFAEISGWAKVSGCFVRENSVIRGAAVVTGATVKGDSLIKDFARVIGPNVSIDDSEVFGSAEIFTGSALWKSKVHCSTVVMAESIINSSVLAGNTKTLNKVTVTSSRRDDRGEMKLTKQHNSLQCNIEGQVVKSCSNQYVEREYGEPVKRKLESVINFESAYHKKPSGNPVAEKESSFDTSRFDEVMSAYATYEKDIVKLIKYPVMTDLTDTHTAAFHSLLRKVRRAVEKEDQKAYDELIDPLDDAFFAAESNARRIATSMFSDEDKSKVTDAGQMIAMALDEGASETEKKNAYKGAMRNLEGRVSIPEVTLMNLIEKIGLKELEA